MMGKGLVLITLGIGYFVLLAAAKEKKQTKLLGQIIGWIIIVSSALGIWCYTQQCMTTMKQGGACPFTGKMTPAPVSQK